MKRLRIFAVVFCLIGGSLALVARPANGAFCCADGGKVCCAAPCCMADSTSCASVKCPVAGDESA